MVPSRDIKSMSKTDPKKLGKKGTTYDTKVPDAANSDSDEWSNKAVMQNDSDSTERETKQNTQPLKKQRVIIFGHKKHHLLRFFGSNPNPTPKAIKKLAMQTGVTNQRINLWFRIQRNKKKNEREKMKNVLFHVIMHNYLKSVTPVVAKSFQEYLEVSNTFNLICYLTLLLKH